MAGRDEHERIRRWRLEWRRVKWPADIASASAVLSMTVQQRLDWIDEMMRLRTEFRPVVRSDSAEDSADSA